MSVTWDDVTGGGQRLLPIGTRNYEVTQAKARINDYNGQREALIAVASSDGAGEFTVPLEAWGPDEDLFLKVVGGQARGLGFVPSRADLDVNRDITRGDIEEFTMYLPSLHGAVVELYVEHKESTKLKDNGEPFVNHRVYANKLVSRRQVAPAAAPVNEYAGVAASSTDDIPW